MSGRGRTAAVPVDLAEPEAPRWLLDAVEAELEPVSGLVLCHCESVDSSLFDTTIESFDRHFAVNARTSWLLIAEFRVAIGPLPAPRIVALTSDHTVNNLPYGASKGALDRIVVAAARELAHLKITANVSNPGPEDTGWFRHELTETVLKANPRGRAETPADIAALVSFLFSDEGAWVNGQLLHCDGGLHA